MSTKGSNITLPPALGRIDPGYDSYMVISDIDKTYLATQIDSIGGLLRTAFETPESKDNVPGFSIVLRALRRGGQDEPQQNPLFFVSASPPQMRSALLAKMQIDGVEHEGIIFKDQLEHVRNREFRKLKEQIGYKLCALLSLWSRSPKKAKLILFGDDSESDPIIYSMFEEILAGRLRGSLLERMLLHLRVFPEEVAKVLDAANQLGSQHYNPIQYIFINLATGSQQNYYMKYGAHMYATENSLQVALVLFEAGLIRERAVASVAREMVLHYDFEPRKLLTSAQRGARRGYYTYQTIQKLWRPLFQVRAFPPPEVIPEFETEMILMRETFLPIKFDSPKAYFENLKNRYSEEGRY